MVGMIHKDGKEVLEEQSLFLPESSDTKTHCALKKVPPVEESIEDSISINNDVKEVLEEQSLILPESFDAEAHCAVNNKPSDEESNEGTSSASVVYSE